MPLQSAATPLFEALEVRQLLSGIAFAHGLWRISTSSGKGDYSVVIQADPNDATMAQAVVNGKVADARKIADIMGIKVRTGPGNDTIQMNLNSAIPCSLYGGAGNDTIRGGPGKDLIVGGPGKDWLYGRSGNDLLLGRGGNDYLTGGTGDDFLKGGNGNDELDGSDGHGNSSDGNDRLFGGGGKNFFWVDTGTVFHRHRSDKDLQQITCGVDNINL